MSHLGRYLLLGFALITGLVVTTMTLHPMGVFDWGNTLVLIATFTQSFLVLVTMFGIFHRSNREILGLKRPSCPLLLTGRGNVNEW